MKKWEIIFEKQIFNRELYQEYETNAQKSMVCKQMQFKNKQYPSDQEDVWVAISIGKKHLASLVIRKCKLKPVWNSTTQRIAKKKKIDNTKCWWGVK